MIRPIIRSLIENPEADSVVAAICEDDASSFLVDWREDDEAIPRYCERVLATGKLSAAMEDDKLFIQFGQKRVQVPLTYSEDDRHITLVALNEALHPDFEVRFVAPSQGRDTLVFVPLPAADWLALERQYGPQKVSAAFRVIRKSPNLFTELIDDQPPGRQDRYRSMTQDDLLDAKAMIGWQLWIMPIIFTAAYLVAAPVAWFITDHDPVAEVICLLMFGAPAAGVWFVRLRENRKFARDKSAGRVQILEGAPERVELAKDGSCFVSIAGTNVRVPSEYYHELREANNVKIEFLPESRIAVRVNVARGMGI